MKKIFLLLCICTAHVGYTQQYLSLTKNCENAHSPFTNVTVIDNRARHQLIGYVQKGATNRREEIIFKGNLADSLAGFFSKVSYGETDGNQLVFILNELFISEVTKVLTESGSLKLSIRLFSQTKRNKFVELLDLDSTYTVNGFDVTKRLLNSVRDQLCVISREISTMQPSSNFPLEYTVDELYHIDSLETLRTPIYNEMPRDGIYKDFEHFKMNEPDIATDIEVEVFRKNASRVFSAYVGTERKVSLPTEGIYAVSDGEKIFKAEPDGYFEVRRRGHDFFYERRMLYSASRYASSSDAAAWSAGFGLMGAAYSASKSDNKSRLYRFRINHRNGHPIPVNEIGR